MSDFMPIAVFFLILAGVMALGFRYQKGQRRSHWQTIAAAQGLRLTTGDDPELRQRLQIYHLFSRGNRPRIEHRLDGLYGNYMVQVLDFAFGNVIDNVTTRHLVLVIAAPSCRGSCAVRVKTGKERVASQAVADPTSQPYPILSREYIVAGPCADEISHQLLAYLEMLAGKNQWLSMESDGASTIFYRPVGDELSNQLVDVFLRDVLYAAQLQGTAHAL